MIEKLLDEDCWPELESLLIDFSSRHGLEGKFGEMTYQKNLDIKAINYMISCLITDSYHSSYVSGKHFSFSIQDLLKWVNESDPNDGYKPFLAIRKNLNSFIAQHEIIKSAQPKAYLIELIDQLSVKNKDKSIHQLYLEARETMK